MLIRNTLLVAVASTSLLCLPAQAYEKGDWVVRLGAANVNPDTSSDNIDVAGLVTLDGVDVDDNTQLGITGSYFITDSWSIELLAATPFEHDISVNGVGIAAGSTKHLPPTLTLNWYPLSEKGGKFQPYLGAGINYTYFFDEDTDSELEAALGVITEPVTGVTDPVPADLDLDDSWGVALRAGFDYALNENWALNAGVWWIDIDTEATISTPLADVKFDVEIDPWVYMVGVAYKF
ncbi:MAG: OmpW family outer membrane protein [Pseudomonadota bacterium]